jgi:DNA polymerase III subunit gamma/tau
MENYLVIARKWRPQTFEEMIGQDHVSQTLHNALNSGRLHHALLFTGPRGVGKTSSARILAKSIKCPNAKAFVPCNQCSTCEEIISGSNIDVMEIDGASHNGVDAIRELRETVGYMPAQGKFKIYIVDEVHMLSVAAFNALLKTLEEPPPHVIFIFATTEPQKIPLTILSRVQRFDFRRIPTRLLAERLEKIAESEGISYDKESLWLIARQADGSARDSQSLLDQIITFTDGKISAQKAIEVLGLTSRQLLLDTVKSLVDQDTQGVLKVARDIYENGSDSKIFVQDLLEAIRNTLFLKLDADNSLVDLPDSEIAILREYAEQLSEEDLHFLFDIALKGSGDVARSTDQRLTLEMLLLRMANAPRIESLGSLAPRVAPKVSVKTSTVVAPKLATAPAARLPPPLKTEASDRFATPAAGESPATIESKKKIELKFDAGTSLADRWEKTVAALKQVSPLLGAKLDHVGLAAYESGKITISLAKDKKFINDQLAEPSAINNLKTAIGELWGETIAISLVEVETSAATPVEGQKKRAADEQARVREEVENHPLIKSVKSNFKVNIKSIEDSRRRNQ